MKIRHKLHLGFGILFIVVIFFGAISLFYLREISNSSRVILKDNYATLRFVRDMRSVLDENDVPLNPIAAERFRSSLVKEQRNVTEKGEAEAVDGLTRNFDSLRSVKSMAKLQDAKRKTLFYLGQIERLNLDAVVRKSDKAEKEVRNASIYLSVGSGLSFLVLFSFIFNLTGFFEEPLRRLTDAIREISRKNFNTKLSFKRDDEFGPVSEAFNTMVSELAEWKSKNEAELIAERLRTEAIVKHSGDAVVAINEKGEIIFINPVAEKLFEVDTVQIRGLAAGKLSEQNPLLKALFGAGAGSLRIRETNFRLVKQEIVVPVCEVPSGDESGPVARTGKTAGEVYILRKE